MNDCGLDILLVEDNPAEARLCLELLRDCGAPARKVKHAACIEEALALLGAEPFNAVLLDVNLPDSAGLQGLERISARYPGAAVVLLTGIDDEALGYKAMQLHAADYLVKGKFAAGLLLRSLRYAVGRKQAEEILRRDKETFERLVGERSRELLAAQRDLEKAKRLSDIGTLAASVAHELRSPLAGIAMAASNIRRKAADPGLDRHFQNIDKKIGESNRIINDLLFYSRLSMPQYAPVDLDAVIEECLNTALYMASGRKSLLIDRALPAKLTIEADPVQVRELLANILGNAFDAIPAGRQGTVSIRTEDDGAAVTVTVGDTGTGVDAKTAGRMFEPFFSTKPRGTGLGLYVCQQIAALHGGDISVSSSPGKGTAVRVTLPKARRSGKVQGAGAAGARQGRT